VVALMAV